MQYIVFTTIILLSSFSIGISCAAISTYDGKPGCKMQGEIGQNYRNFWDPLRYWRCIGLNMGPLEEYCPNGTGFQQSLSRCVSWTIWRWETPQYPPSCPNGVMCSPISDLQPSSAELVVPASQTPILPPYLQSQPLQSLRAIPSVQPVPTKQHFTALESARPITPSQPPIQYSAAPQIA